MIKSRVLAPERHVFQQPRAAHSPAAAEQTLRQHPAPFDVKANKPTFV